MKKIIIATSTLFCLFTGAVMAQSTPASGAKIMTVQEANKLNGIAQPTINGKPYSQYQAEQAASKQAANQKTTAADVKAVSGSDFRQSVVTATPANQEKVTTASQVKQSAPVENAVTNTNALVPAPVVHVQADTEAVLPVSGQVIKPVAQSASASIKN